MTRPQPIKLGAKARMMVRLCHHYDGFYSFYGQDKEDKSMDKMKVCALDNKDKYHYLGYLTIENDKVIFMLSEHRVKKLAKRHLKR